MNTYVSGQLRDLQPKYKARSMVITAMSALGHKQSFKPSLAECLLPGVKQPLNRPKCDTPASNVCFHL